MEKQVHVHTRLERSGYHWHTEERAEGVDIEFVAPFFELIIHVEGANHAYVHIHQLCSQVKVAFDVGGIDHVDDDIRFFLEQVFPDIQLLRTIAGEGICAGQVGKMEGVILEFRRGLRRIYGHPRVVAHPGMSP